MQAKPKTLSLDRKNVFAKDLIFAMPFGLGTKVLKDYGPSRKNGTTNNSPTRFVGEYGVGLDFQTNQYVDISTTSVIGKQTRHTVVAIMSPDGVGGGEQFVYAENTASGIVYFLGMVDGYVRFAIYNGITWAYADGDGSGSYPAAPLTAGKTHIIGGTLGPNGTIAYLDGKIVDVSGGTTVPAGTINDVELGRYTNGGGGGYFDGKIYGVYGWKREFTPNEMADFCNDPFQIFVRPKMSLGKAPAAAAATNSNFFMFFN